MVLDPVLRKRSSNAFGHISILALIGGIAGAVYAYGDPGPAFGGLLMVDGFATFFRVLVMGVGILTVLPSYGFLRREGAETGEFHALLLFSIAGQCIMASANELIVIFIGLEISSIASYVLAGYLRDDKRANEAALKYFLLGSFATAFFLYGVALDLRSHGHGGSKPGACDDLGPQRPVARICRRGRGVDVCGACVQGFRGAVPDLGAGRLSGSAHPGGRVPFRRVRKRRPFAVFLRIFMTAFEPIGGGWEPLVVDRRAAFDDHWKLRGAAAIERQAAAGV